MASSKLLLYFENPVGALYEHPDGFAVVQYSAGPRRLDDFQAFLTQVGDLLRLRGWYRILGDQRVMTRFNATETDWLTANWLGPASDRPAGLHTAVILPRDAFASLAVSQLLYDARVATLTYRLFDEDQQAEAEAWLRQLGPVTPVAGRR